MSVKIIASKNNNVFEPTAKYATNGGLLMLAIEEVDETPQGFTSFRSTGFVERKARRIAFLKATQAQFDTIFKTEGVVPAAGATLPGIIAITETLTPINAKDPMQGLKTYNEAARKAGKFCTTQGKPIYRITEWFPEAGDRTADMGDFADVLIAHDNQNELAQFVGTMNTPAKANTPAIQNASPVAAPGTRRRGATA